jgi:hypothetical protein
MRDRATAIALVLASTLLAGCAQHSAPEPTSRPLEISEAPAAETTLLRVLVINDEYLPIKGAKVSVIGLGLNGTTDDVGNAYFQIATPGRYAVHVHHSKFYPNISKVSVEGDAKQVERITLLDAPPDTHFSDFYYFEGVCEPTLYVQAIGTSPHCQDQGLVKRDQPPPWFLAPGLEGGFVRLAWNPELYGSQKMRLELAFPEAGAFANGEERLVAEGTPPVLIELNRDLITPAMQRNGVPIQIFVGVPADDAAAANVYQVFSIEAQFDYFQAAPDVDHH